MRQLYTQSITATVDVKKDNDNLLLLSLLPGGDGGQKYDHQYLKRRTKNEPRLAVPSCHGRR